MAEGDTLSRVERDVFARRLHAAAIAARDFAREFIQEALPDPMQFRLRLNSSYDGNPRVGDEVVFREDSSFQRAEQLRTCDEDHVVAELWRNGHVPEWIDVAVIGETGSATLLQLMCCGRFTAQDELLYHAWEGRPPFHVTGPTLPVSYQDGQKFSIYDRAECWTLGDLDHLRGNAHKVWSLDLVGHFFDDAVLVKLPDLCRMELLELRASSISGAGLVDLLRFPKLRVLRIRLDRNEAFRIPKFPRDLAALETFDIDDPPARPWGFSSIAERAGRLASLTFKSSDELVVDGVCPGTVQTLSVQAKRIRAGFDPPETIDTIYAHLSEMGDRDVDDWLSSVKQIRGLDLSGTPIGDVFAESVPARFGLTYLNVVQTNVSEAAVRRIGAAHPKLKVLPNLKRLVRS